MTRTTLPCSQTICQKSATVCAIGPWKNMIISLTKVFSNFCDKHFSNFYDKNYENMEIYLGDDVGRIAWVVVHLGNKQSDTHNTM